MSAFFNYFYELTVYIFRHILGAFGDFFKKLGGLFDIKYYKRLLATYKSDFGAWGWILAIFSFILIGIILILVAFLVFRLIKRLLTFRRPIKENEELKDEITSLKHEMLKLSYERDKILAMQVANLGLGVNKDLLPDNAKTTGIEDQQEIADQEELNQDKLNKSEDKDAQHIVKSDSANGANAVHDEDENNMVDADQLDVVDPTMRFNRLAMVDRYYLSGGYKAPVYNDDITLEDLCKDFRNFAASKLGLYYELDLIKFFFAALGATKMIILQGISGTGKTSLPYAFGQFIQNPSVICPVQPAWRDRTELFGYYNEFTKKFNETEFLKTIYEADYYEDPKFIVLDEMNIARVEYYFAEMLSILEMPRIDERNISIVSSVWDNDPKKLNDGKVFIAPNVWYIGTINNDDSTFAVADKVYDRAIPIDLDTKAARFDAPVTEPVHIRYDHLNEMFEKAKTTYPLSEESKAKLEEVDSYIIKHFRLTFGNRILKQINEFIPCYVACGGTELDGIDFMLAQKILRKFSSLNIGYIRDEIDGFVSFLNDTFGYDSMTISKEFLGRIKKMV